MAIDTTLRLLTKASGLSVTDLATAIPRAGVKQAIEDAYITSAR